MKRYCFPVIAAALVLTWSAAVAAV